MNEFHKTWLAALRSGEYKQTIGHLRTQRGYCCIGVASDVLLKPQWVDRGSYFTFTEAAVKGSLALPVQEWQTFSASPSLRIKLAFTPEFISALITLNDDIRFTFEQIADYVEGKINNGTAFRG